MIIIKNLIKTYRTGHVEVPVLKNISFQVPKNQFIAITGRSGSGKSTLLYQLSLLDHPTSGSITINDKDISTLRRDERVAFRLYELGYIFQDYALLPSLSAIENVMTPLLMQGFTSLKAEEMAKKALDKVGLGDKLSNLPNQLSGGQQQRVSIARAIVHKPKVLFADEPTANLDTESSDVVLDIFTSLNKEGLTIIMVTHEAEYAKRAHRIITLSDGKIVSDVMNKKR